MATVRIYKVAELLGTTSEEVSTLLTREHGIEVKSASSTIEEVVARQFVERLARQRHIALPGGDIFADTPALKGKKGAQGKKPVEPPKPAAPSLPPPRLVKTAKPVAEPIAEAEPEAPPALEVQTPEPHPSADAEAPSPPEARAEASVELPLAPSTPVGNQGELAAGSAQGAAEPAPKPPAPGRIIPPTLRLRIEEQRPTMPMPPLPTAPPRVVPRPATPKTGRPASPIAARPATGGAAGQPGTGAARPPGQSMPPRPAGAPARPPYPGSTARPTPGGQIGRASCRERV